MTNPGDIEARVSALEVQVAELVDLVRQGRQDAAAARVLAGGADRDVAEMRGQWERSIQLHNATRDDLAELRQRVEEGFGRVDALERRVETGFQTVAAGQRQLVEMLSTLIERDDRAGGE